VSALPFGITYGNIQAGEVSGSATAKQLPSIPCQMVCITALNSNAGDVYVGGSGVTVPNGTTDTTSGIELQPEVVADATIGGPQPIDLTLHSGTVTCLPPAPTSTPAPQVSGVPHAGTGGSNGGLSLGWLVAVLAALGLGGIAWSGAARSRAERERPG